MKGKSHVKLIILFSAIVFAFFALTIVVGGFISFLYLSQAHDFVPPPRLQDYMLILAAMSVLVSTILALLLSRMVFKPLLSLSDATRRVSEGDFQVRVALHANIKELDDLATNFNNMVQELENTETFRSDFIRNVSHEFKTPISAIEGYAMLLQDSALTQQERDEYLSRILESTKRLSNVTGNILMLSKLEHLDQLGELRHFSLDEQLRRIVLFLEPEWMKRDLELELQLESIDYLGSQELLVQVWLNILENAFKFSKPGGMVEIHLSEQEQQVILTVCDYGIGMTEDAQRRIFERFYQEDSSRATSGNGLGMSLAKRIIDLHQGRIQVSSVQGKGTAITVQLPIMT